MQHQQAEDNMKTLNFQSVEEFETLFKKKTLDVTDTIVDCIESAMSDNLKSADLFRVTIEQGDHSYVIALVRSEWSKALQSCLDYYHEHNHADQAIDTWKLLELAKVW